MKSCRIHIMGASGSGVTSLGRALADVLAVPHHDTDDYLWQPTTPPYRDMRGIPERLRLMREMFSAARGLGAERGTRGLGRRDHSRLRRSDLPHHAERDPPAALARPRGHGTSAAMRWLPAAGGIGRPRISSNGRPITRTAIGRDAVWQRHKTWLAALPCPVLRLDGSRPLPQLVAACVAGLGRATLSP